MYRTEVICLIKPLAKTIKIYTKTIYDGHLPTPVIPKHVFIELIKTATTLV